MISIRSSATMISTRRGCVAGLGAVHYPIRLARATAVSGNGATIVSDDHPTVTARRHQSSPAYRRYIKNQQSQYSSRYPPQQSIGHKRAKVVPSLLISKSMPTGFSEMDNGSLLTIAEMGNHSAREEVLKRHIMAVDEVGYGEACETFRKIAAKNREGMTAAIFPYQLGIATALICGFGAIPMVFDVNTAIWFNHHFVTQEIPEPHDLETSLEVGAWAWNWMEPPLGTASFVLLCLQFSREQMKNMGIKPYTEKIKEIHGRKLAKSFPRYDPKIILEYVETDPMVKVRG